MVLFHRAVEPIVLQSGRVELRLNHARRFPTIWLTRVIGFAVQSLAPFPPTGTPRIADLTQTMLEVLR